MKRNKYLLDTCICVYWLRNKYSMDLHINEVGMENCFISEITIAELKFGKVYGQLKGGPKYRDQLLEQFLDDINILPIAPILDSYAEEKARLVVNGKPMSDFDLFIGCTAAAKKMILVTENVKDFVNIRDLKMENWVDKHNK